MKVYLILAEAGTSHPDGTVSLLRAGINQIWGKLPVMFQGCLYVRIEADAGEAGTHTVRIQITDEDGKAEGFRLDGGFEVQPGGSVSNLLLNVAAVFQKYGTSVIYVAVDGTSRETWRIKVADIRP